jgi:hypothetical protein
MQKEKKQQSLSLTNMVAEYSIQKSVNDPIHYVNILCVFQCWLIWIIVPKTPILNPTRGFYCEK